MKALVEDAGKKKKIEIVGMLWMQGESDAKPQFASAYGENLKNFIETVRKDFENPDLFFVAGRINPTKQNYDQKLVRIVRTAQESCPLEGYAWVDCDDLTKVGDNVHYDTEGLVELGYRMADTMMKLMEMKE